MTLNDLFQRKLSSWRNWLTIAKAYLLDEEPTPISETSSTQSDLTPSEKAEADLSPQQREVLAAMRGESRDSLDGSPVRVPAVTSKPMPLMSSGRIVGSKHHPVQTIRGRQKGDPYRVMTYTDPFFQAFAADVFNKKFADQLPEGVKFSKVELVTDDND